MFIVCLCRLCIKQRLNRADLGVDLYTTGMSMALLGLLSHFHFSDNHLHGDVLVRK